MTKQQIIQRLYQIKEEIMFPSCPEDFTPIHRLGRVSQQLEDLIGDIELDLEPVERGPEVSCEPTKPHNGTVI